MSISADSCSPAGMQLACKACTRQHELLTMVVPLPLSAPAQPPASVLCAAETFGDKTPFERIDPGMCENYHEQCENWAKSGECEKNPGYMVRLVQERPNPGPKQGLSQHALHTAACRVAYSQQHVQAGCSELQ